MFFFEAGQTEMGRTSVSVQPSTPPMDPHQQCVQDLAPDVRDNMLLQEKRTK